MFGNSLFLYCDIYVHATKSGEIKLKFSTTQKRQTRVEAMHIYGLQSQRPQVKSDPPFRYVTTKIQLRS